MARGPRLRRARLIGRANVYSTVNAVTTTTRTAFSTSIPVVTAGASTTTVSSLSRCRMSKNLADLLESQTDHGDLRRSIHDRPIDHLCSCAVHNEHQDGIRSSLGARFDFGVDSERVLVHRDFHLHAQPRNTHFQ